MYLFQFKIWNYSQMCIVWVHSVRWNKALLWTPHCNEMAVAMAVPSCDCHHNMINHILGPLPYYLWPLHMLHAQSCQISEMHGNMCHKCDAVNPTPIARLMGPAWGPSGADRTQVGPTLATETLLSGQFHPRISATWSSQISCRSAPTYPLWC